MRKFIEVEIANGKLEVEFLAREWGETEVAISHFKGQGPAPDGLWSPQWAVDRRGAYSRGGEEELTMEGLEEALLHPATTALFSAGKNDAAFKRRGYDSPSFNGGYLAAEAAARGCSDTLPIFRAFAPEARNLSEVRKTLGKALMRKVLAAPSEWGAAWIAFLEEGETSEYELFGKQFVTLMAMGGLPFLQYMARKDSLDVEVFVEGMNALWPRAGSQQAFLNSVLLGDINPMTVNYLFHYKVREQLTTTQIPPNWQGYSATVLTETVAEDWAAPEVPPEWPREGWVVEPIDSSAALFAVAEELGNCSFSHRNDLALSNERAFRLVSPNGEVGLVGVKKIRGAWRSGYGMCEGVNNAPLIDPGFQDFQERLIKLYKA